MRVRILFTALAAALVLAAPAKSQAPETPKSALEVVRAMQATNKQLLEKQAKTISTIEDMAKTAEQMKILSKRT